MSMNVGCVFRSGGFLLLRPVRKSAFGVLLALLAFDACRSSCRAQGSLVPPGPPGPTMKTLGQIEPRAPISSVPFTITNSGSYYLTTNLTLASAFENGIEILANNVTIDLQGFTLSGQNDAFSGVVVLNAQTNIVVRNGTVRGWSYRGVDAENAVNGGVFQVCASENGDSGIVIGSGAAAVQCMGVSNGYAGVIGGSGCVLQACTATYNANVGIAANAGSTISDCTSVWNIGGISIGSGGTVRGCAAGYNQEDGINANAATVVDCTVQANQYRGIVVSQGSTVSRCTVRVSSQHGIQVSSHCQIVGNTCELNGYNDVGAGILVLGSGNRIEANHVANNDYGIQVTATNNLIIRNSATGNGTNYLFVGAQIFGPTNNLVGTGGVVTNENPWANFAF